MSAWIKGWPTSPGVYWVIWEDHGGYPSSCLCVVQMRAAADAPPFPQFRAGDDLRPHMDACDEWHAAHLRLMYRAAETDPGAWHRVSEMGWRVTHHQPIQRPDPDGGGR
jgi:hypothetical protein